MLLLKLLLEAVDFFLEDVDPLCELGCRQLLFLVIAGAERWTPPAAAESHCVNSAPPKAHTGKTAPSVLPDERVCVGRRRGYFGVRQVLLALPVGVETRWEHGVAVFLQQLAHQKTAGVRRQSWFLTVHALPLQRGVGCHWLWGTKISGFYIKSRVFLVLMQTWSCKKQKPT